MRKKGCHDVIHLTRNIVHLSWTLSNFMCSKYLYMSKWVDRFWLVKALSCIVHGGQNNSKTQSKMSLCAHLGQHSKPAVDWFWPLCSCLLVFSAHVCFLVFKELQAVIILGNILFHTHFHFLSMGIKCASPLHPLPRPRVHSHIIHVHVWCQLKTKLLNLFFLSKILGKTK